MAALLGHPDFEETDTSFLDCITFGAMNSLPEHSRACIENLKAKRAVNVFGMSECGPAWVGGKLSCFLRGCCILHFCRNNNIQRVLLPQKAAHEMSSSGSLAVSSPQSEKSLEAS